MERPGKQHRQEEASCGGCCGGSNDSSQPLPGWSYSGPTGPEHWGDLDPRFAAAKTGRCQSPIDLTGPLQAGIDGVVFSYRAAPLNVTNNGHSIQVDCPPGSSMTLGDRRYELRQFHFHTPSEHTVDGRFYEMELHLVHQDAEGRFAVVGVFLTTGDEHPTLSRIWEQMPRTVGETFANDTPIDPSDFLPADLSCIEYEGSLTTPPCTEGVAWVMLMEPSHAPAAQIEQFTEVIGQNNRPVQPLNDRVLRCGS